MSDAAGPILRRPARLTFAAALAVYGALAAWLVWRTSILEPYSDMFDWLVRWRRFQADGELGRYLWAPHNFHHLVWTFSILDLDIRAFGASGYLFLATGVACFAAVAAMLGWLGAAAASPGLRLVGGGVAAALCLMGCDVLDATADINGTYLHALVFAVAAILLAEAPGGRGPMRLAGVLACAVAAGLGSAAGLAVWAALVFGAWRRGDRLAVLVLAAAGLAFSLIYVLGQSPAALDGGAAPGGVPRLASGAALAINYLALPWVRAAPRLGLPIGVVMLGVTLAALAYRGFRATAWTERAAVRLILFSLVTAVLAGVARTGATAPSLVPMRYAVFLAPLHVGLWVLIQPALAEAARRRPKVAQTATVALAGLLLAHQVVMAVFAIRTADPNLRIIADFHAGRRYPAMHTFISPDIPRAEALSAWLKAQGYYRRELRPAPAPLTDGSGISVSSTGP